MYKTRKGRQCRYTYATQDLVSQLQMLELQPRSNRGFYQQIVSRRAWIRSNACDIAARTTQQTCETAGKWGSQNYVEELTSQLDQETATV